MATPQASTASILSFIRGRAVEAYGDTDIAKEVEPILLSSMKIAVERAYEFKDPVRFLGLAYLLFSFYADEKLVDISKTFRTDWSSHYRKWYTDYAKSLTETPGSISDVGLLSPEDSENDANTTFDTISHTLFEWYLDTLGELASKQQETARLTSNETPFRQNFNTISTVEWDDAWATEFRGDVLRRLEFKLHLNSVAVVTREDKKFMSRIIPVIQASGTGKSRLAEE